MGYNGHPSYEHWNASLWVNNEELLYLETQRMSRSEFVEEFGDGFQTPDGVVFTPELAGYAWDSAQD